VKVWCSKCADYTLLNARKVCLFCDSKITEKNIIKARKESR